MGFVHTLNRGKLLPHAASCQDLVIATRKVRSTHFFKIASFALLPHAMPRVTGGSLDARNPCPACFFSWCRVAAVYKPMEPSSLREQPLPHVSQALPDYPWLMVQCALSLPSFWTTYGLPLPHRKAAYLFWGLTKQDLVPGHHHAYLDPTQIFIFNSLCLSVHHTTQLRTFTSPHPLLSPPGFVSALRGGCFSDGVGCRAVRDLTSSTFHNSGVTLSSHCQDTPHTGVSTRPSLLSEVLLLTCLCSAA